MSKQKNYKRKPTLPYDATHKIIDDIEHKMCRECNKFFPMTNEYFYKNSSNKTDGFNTYCIECTFARATKWVENNPEKYKSQMLRKVENKTDIQRQRSRDAANKNRKEGYTKQWQIDNKEKLRGYRLKRNQSKTHLISENEWENCKNYFNYRCGYCGIAIEEHYIQYKGNWISSDFHKEHVTREGKNDLSNCIPSCRSCNSRKWVHDIKTWYKESNSVFDENREIKINEWLENDYKLYITSHDKT